MRTPNTTMHLDALRAARESVPHGWIRQANPHRLAPALKAAGDAAREVLAGAESGDRGPIGTDVEHILTSIDAFAANPGHILERRKAALALSSKLTNTITRHAAPKA